jgi:hypothetical protein
METIVKVTKTDKILSLCMLSLMPRGEKASA